MYRIIAKFYEDNALFLTCLEKLTLDFSETKYLQLQSRHSGTSGCDNKWHLKWHLQKI